MSTPIVRAAYLVTTAARHQTGPLIVAIGRRGGGGSYILALPAKPSIWC